MGWWSFCGGLRNKIELLLLFTIVKEKKKTQWSENYNMV